MTRVAVQLGAAWLRVAIDDPRPRLLAELPVRDADPSGVLSTALTALLDDPADELLVVYTRGALPMVPPGAAAALRAVPATVAVLGGVPARVGAVGPTAAGPSTWNAQADGSLAVDVVVVDVGHSGTEIARVCGGRVVATRRIPVGGAVLDDAAAELLGGGPGSRDAGPGGRAVRRIAPQAGIRAARETLSLQPVVGVGAPPVELHADAMRCALAPHLAAVVDGVRTVCDGVGPGRSPPVLLVGGVVRAPLLAELLDAAGIDDVRVAVRPDSAAVVGALRLPPELLGPPLVACGVGRPVPSSEMPFGPPPESSSAESSGGSSAASFATRDGAPAPFWLPPVPRPRGRPLRGVAVAAAAAVALSGLYAAGAALPAEPVPPLAAAGELVQYGYAVRLPSGWAHTGGLPERRRSLLTPVGAPDGGNLISVERTLLGYDADAEPQRARAELRAEYARAVTDGAPLAGFDDDARFAGRPVVAYRETASEPASEPGDGAGGMVQGADAARVDWYVLLDGDAQLSVGCRHTAAGATAVTAACATVVGSLHRTP